jgi:hypothetical protein
MLGAAQNSAAREQAIICFFIEYSPSAVFRNWRPRKGSGLKEFPRLKNTIGEYFQEHNNKMITEEFSCSLRDVNYG